MGWWWVSCTEAPGEEEEVVDMSVKRGLKVGGGGAEAEGSSGWVDILGVGGWMVVTSSRLFDGSRSYEVLFVG